MQLPILFIDVDGTLIDSLPGISSAVAATFRDNSLPMPSPAQLHRLPGPPIADTFASWGLPASDIPRLVDEYRVHYKQDGWLGSELFPGWAEALPRWKDAGWTLCTATSKGDAIAAHILEHLGVAEYFDFIGGADDEGGTRRTKQLVIEWVLDNMRLRGREEDILMVGDRHHDVDGARPLGIRTALVGWGHGTQTEFDDADFYAPDFASLERIIAEFPGR